MLQKSGTLVVLTPTFLQMVQKHSALINFMKLPKDTNKYPHILVHETYDSINKGVIAEDNWVPTQNTLLVD